MPSGRRVWKLWITSQAPLSVFAGVAPRLNAHKHWNMNRIMPKTLKHLEDPKVKATRDLTMGNESGKCIILQYDLTFSKTIPFQDGTNMCVLNDGLLSLLDFK